MLKRNIGALDVETCVKLHKCTCTSYYVRQNSAIYLENLNDQFPGSGTHKTTPLFAANFTHIKGILTDFI